MRQVCFIILGLSVLGTIGCGGHSQPYMTSERLDRGLVIVLPGVEGRSILNEHIVKGINEGGVKYAINLWDWTDSWFWFVNLESQSRNRRKAQEIATYITRYHWAYPGRPVYIVGQSGGGAIAAWTAEQLKDSPVDGIIMLAAALSPGYPLDKALTNSRNGIVNFYSGRDVVMLGIGTKIFRTMDGQHVYSAGMVGFDVPKPNDPLYGKLYQVPWNERMAEAGNHGLHLTSGASAFVAEYVSPLILQLNWNRQLVDKVAAGPEPTSKADHAPPVTPKAK